MSYHEELLIRIRSAYEGGGFSSLSADMSKAKAGYNQVANSADTTGSTIGRAISQGATVASAGMNKLKTTASSTFGQIKAGASAAKSSLGDMGTLITGLVGGFGIMEVINTMWTGATQKQFNQAELSMKLGTEKAQEYVNIISKVVEITPGDDTFMGGLLSGAVAKQGNLTSTELTALGNLTSDYVVKSRSMGKALLETQMDIKEYIMSGNTGQLERDSILKAQLGTLQGQGTVSERIVALDKAMQAEGYKGLSQLDVAMIKWDLMVGKLKTAATTIGEKFLPYIEAILDWFIKLNDETNGWSSILIVAIGSLGLLALALAPLVGATMSGYYAMKNYRIEAEKAALANAGNKGPGTGTGGSGSNVGAVLSGLVIAAATIYVTHALIEWSESRVRDPNYKPTAGGKPLTAGDETRAIDIKSKLLVEWDKNPIFKGVVPTFPIGLDISMQNFDIVKMIEENLGKGGLPEIISGYIEKPLQDAYISVKNWWDGLPGWFSGLGSRIGQVWQDVVNYFNDKTTIGGQVYDGLKKIYCIIMGCSPGIIPALQMLYLYAVFVFNAMLSPVLMVKNTIEGFVLYIMLRMALLQNDIITKWNLVKAIVGVWIQTGISIFTDPLGWAKDRYNDAKNFINPWISSGVNVATNAIKTAWDYWERFKNFVQDPVRAVVDVVYGGNAGSPTEVDYLYGQGQYYEPNYSPILTSTSVAPVATAPSTTSTVIKAPVTIKIGSVDSEERVKEVENAVTIALSDINDSKGR